MKTPRITDFDPDAKVATLKSSLDSMPSIHKTPAFTPPPSRQNTPTNIAPNKQTRTVKIENTPASPSRKRLYVRRTFDFYDDQITYMIRHSLEERLAERQISMNEMVREALDDWIQKLTSEK